MAFRILDEEELLFLDEQERALYEAELSLYQQRCALAEQIERSEQSVHVEPFKASLKPISPIHTIDNKEMVFVESEVAILVDDDVTYSLSSRDFVFEEKIEIAVPQLELSGNIETRMIQEPQLQKMDIPSVAIGDVNIKSTDAEIEVLNVNAEITIADVRRPELKQETPVINVRTATHQIQPELNILELRGYSGINDIELHEKEHLPELMVPTTDKEEQVQLVCSYRVINPDLDIKTVTGEVDLSQLHIDATFGDEDYAAPVLTEAFKDMDVEVTVLSTPVTPSFQAAAVRDQAINVQIPVRSDVEAPVLHYAKEMPELIFNHNIQEIHTLSFKDFETLSIQVSGADIDIKPIQTREYHAQPIELVCVSKPEVTSPATVRQVETREIKVNDIPLTGVKASINAADVTHMNKSDVRIKMPEEVALVKTRQINVDSSVSNAEMTDFEVPQLKMHWSTGIQNMKQIETSIQHENVNVSISTPKMSTGTVSVNGISVWGMVTLPDAGNVWNVLLREGNAEA